jgi:hypothetical protein
MKLRTYAWELQAPGDVEHAEFILPDGKVRPYVTRLEAAARAQGFSFSVYDAGVLPWASLWGYDASTGLAGVYCGLHGCITPVGVMP